MIQHPWWQTSVFYQIYPRSFADGNGDGIGDFAGMTARLDYLQKLGIGAIWLSPHYPSPFLDCGYDISDYSAVGPEYGTLDDFKRFLDAAHARDMRVVLDLVLNHTSDQHAWFVESRASRNNPRRDWYIWREGRAGGPPNNWASIFGGSAWELDATTGQYYYHAFLKEQPDLNWRNPELKQAMGAMIRFWLDLGVDGFRLDALATIYEHPDLPDQSLPLAVEEIIDANLLNKSDYQQLMRFQLNQPGVHELMQELRTLINSYPGERVLIGEDENLAYHGSANDELHLVFNFPLMEVRRLTPAHIRANQAVRLAEIPADAWPCNTLGNHDGRRLWSRYGDGMHDAELARLHLALLLTLKGTPFLYNGEEIGMSDLELHELSQFRDTAALGQYQRLTERLGKSPHEAMQVVIETTRDRCRSPMQWNNAANAGFCPADVQPWLPVNPNYAMGVNVTDQEQEPGSVLNFYRRLVHLRQSTPALILGKYQALHSQSVDYLAFLRSDADSQQTCLVILNFSSEQQTLIFELDEGQPRMLFSSVGRNEHTLNLDWLCLEPFEILIAELV